MNIYPFKGILYNTDKLDIKDVVTFPYDKITLEQKTIYEKRSPYNMVHLILPKSHNDAGALYRQWLGGGILQEDAILAVYVYEQEYGSKTRRGFIALLELQPFGKDTIMPHEKTFSNIVEDRIGLLDSCKANIEQIFILYTDKEINDCLSGRPRIDFKDEFGVGHKLWSITDTAVIKTIQDNIKNAQLFIADGHHRYTASLLYKKEKFIMATFINSDDPGLTILPTHRVLLEIPKMNLLERLREYFIVEKSGVRHHFSIYLGGDLYYSLRLKESTSLEKVLGLNRPRAWLYLDVNILHLLIIKHIMGAKEGENIIYLREEDKAVDMVRNKGAGAAFILNPTRIEDVKRIVSLGEVMPHKSTDFYPKLHSGLVMRSF